jgi:hypothetical protein
MTTERQTHPGDAVNVAAQRDGRETRATRQAVFTFLRQSNFELDDWQLAQVCSLLGLQSTAELDALAETVAGRARDQDTEDAYEALDRKVLPGLELMVFFQNFSEPERIFARPEELLIDMAAPGPDLKGCRLTYFAVWDSVDDGKRRPIEIALEAKIGLEVCPDVDVENPYDVEGEGLQEQLQECRNMFNFAIKGFEYDDDEALDHEWSASFV